jgi:SAM-dependent methyltransferase
MDFLLSAIPPTLCRHSVAGGEAIVGVPLSHAEIMHAIHGVNVFAGYIPMFAEDSRGWNSEHASFDQAVASIRPTVVIDVGVWKGGSTIYLAGLLRHHKLSGTVISVDTFLGSLEHIDRTSGASDLIGRRHGMPVLYDQFLSNIVRRGLTGSVVPLPQTSVTAALLLRKIGIQAGLVHIDASHEYTDVLNDARAYWDVLAPGGYLIGDDYHHYWPAVIKAADEFAREKGVPLSASDPKWIVRKP